MRHLLLILALISPAFSQVSSTAKRIQSSGTLPGTCPGGGWVFVKTGAVSPGLYDCPTAGGPPRLIASAASAFTNRGTWSSVTTYALNDLVAFGTPAISYLSLQASNTNHSPDVSPTWWATLGPPGAQGSAGSTGATGPTGNTGNAGSNGTNGNSVLNGSGAPSGGTGVNGDWYINTAANTIYGPKTAGAWGSPTSIIGPQGSTGPAGATGAQGPTVYPGAGIPQSSGAAWNSSLTLDTDGTLAANSDTKLPSQKAVKTKIDSLMVWYGKGDYNTMTAALTAPENSIWLLTNATASGLCGNGGGGAKAVCIKNALGTWDSIIASGGTGGGGGGGGTGTIYGGWTGGGTVVNVTDSDCNTGDDTSAVQAKLNSVANNGTLDFTMTTNNCDINTAGLTHTSSWTNVRITRSGTKSVRGIAAGAYTPPESAMIYIENCTNCLFDHMLVDGNSKQGGVYLYSWTNGSAQNNEIHHIADGVTGPYAALKIDNSTDIWIVSNNIHDTEGVAPDVTGVRGIWCGVDVGRYCTRPTIINNTVTNTGHTGIASEGQQIVMSNNTVSNILTQGTGLKIISRGTASDHIVDGNSVTNTYNGGFQVDGSGVDALHLYVRNNFFTDISVSASTFGALYAANGSMKKNIQFTGNTLTRCKLIAGLGYVDNVLLQNNTLITPVAPDGQYIAIEQQATNVQAFNTGTVIIQGGCSGTCSNIYQDGVQLASLPQIDRNTVWAYAQMFKNLEGTFLEGEI